MRLVKSGPSISMLSIDRGNDKNIFYTRMKIGVFDSGIGGITVLTEIARQFPGHEFSYFGDTANVPYGSKSPAQIKNLCTSAAERIHKHKLDLVVVACNTAASHALTEIKKELKPIPVIDVVSAGVSTISKQLSIKEINSVLVLATKSTVQSHIYHKQLSTLRANLQIIEQPCPLLVPLIEEGWVSHKILNEVVKEYLSPYFKTKHGLALLACTHYPWIKSNFEKLLTGWKVVDSAMAVTEMIRATSPNLNLQSKKPKASRYKWFFSDPEAVPRFPFSINQSLPKSPKILAF